MLGLGGQAPAHQEAALSSPGSGRPLAATGSAPHRNSETPAAAYWRIPAVEWSERRPPRCRV